MNFTKWTSKTFFRPKYTLIHNPPQNLQVTATGRRDKTPFPSERREIFPAPVGTRNALDVVLPISVPSLADSAGESTDSGYSRGGVCSREKENRPTIRSRAGEKSPRCRAVRREDEPVRGASSCSSRGCRTNCPARRRTSGHRAPRGKGTPRAPFRCHRHRPIRTSQA